MSEHMEQLAEANARSKQSGRSSSLRSLAPAPWEALAEQILPVWWVKLGFPSTRPLRRLRSLCKYAYKYA